MSFWENPKTDVIVRSIRNEPNEWELSSSWDGPKYLSRGKLRLWIRGGPLFLCIMHPKEEWLGLWGTIKVWVATRCWMKRHKASQPPEPDLNQAELNSWNNNEHQI